MDSVLKGHGMERREAKVEKMSISDSVSSFSLSAVKLSRKKFKIERQPAVQCMSQHAVWPNHRNDMLIYS